MEGSFCIFFSLLLIEKMESKSEVPVRAKLSKAGRMSVKLVASAANCSSADGSAKRRCVVFV